MSDLPVVIGISLIFALAATLIINAVQAYQANKTTRDLSKIFGDALDKMTETIKVARSDIPYVDKFETFAGKFIPLDFTNKLLDFAIAASQSPKLDGFLTEVKDFVNVVGDGKPNVASSPPPADTK